MWIRTEKGDARNLDLAYKIEMGEYRGKVKVWASFPIICTGKTIADPAFVEQSTLKTFSNIDDAEVFIDELVTALNGNKNDALGYSFNWLKKSKSNEPANVENPKNETLVDDVDGVPF